MQNEVACVLVQATSPDADGRHLTDQLMLFRLFRLFRLLC